MTDDHVKSVTELETAELETALTNCLIEFSEKVSIAQILTALFLRAASIAVKTSGGVDSIVVRTAYLDMAATAFDVLLNKSDKAIKIEIGKGIGEA
jgi:hypothetical protein